MDLSTADFSGKNLSGVDFSKCTGLTGTQLATASDLYACTLPDVDFTGVVLSEIRVTGVDFSKCTNLTASQLLSASSLIGAKLPSVDFTGANLAGKYLYGVDFTQCTGLTGTQLAAASSISSIYLTQAQYDAMKADLPSGTRIYVNGKSTRIP